MTKQKFRNMREATKAAIAAAGGPTQMGAKLGITGQAVSQWEKVPSARVRRVSRLSKIALSDLRPDLYG